LLGVVVEGALIKRTGSGGALIRIRIDIYRFCAYIQHLHCMYGATKHPL
jgi:hypothetical protein